MQHLALPFDKQGWKNRQNDANLLCLNNFIQVAEFCIRGMEAESAWYKSEMGSECTCSSAFLGLYCFRSQVEKSSKTKHTSPNVQC